MNIVRKIATKISKKNIFLRNIMRKTLNLLKKMKYNINTFGQKIDDKTIIFCSFNGKSYSCSPKAIYELMLNNEKYNEFKFIWALKDLEIHSY